jgi:long-chain fatty acid transport protein
MKQIYSFYLFLGLFLIPTIAFSQGFQVNFQGQKQQAMGCAGTALQTDGASLFFNPGASAFAKENSVNVATTPIFANVMYIDSATNDVYRTENPVGTPFSAYGLFQLKEDGKLKLGIAVYTPFGSTVQWEKNWIGRFAITRLELKAIFIQPTVSYRISDKIGVGAGFVYSTGNVNLQKDIPVQFEDGTFAKAELAGKAQGFGYNLGVQINATEKLGIGLNFRSKVQMNLNDGEATFTVPSGLDPNFPDGKFVGGLPLPQVTTLGLSYKLDDKWAFVLDINHVAWKAYDTLAFDYETNTTSLLDTKSARDYKNIVAFRAGAAYKVMKNLEIRFGGGYGLTPVQDGYVTPETPDGNRAYGTFGLGYELGEHFAIDASCYYTQITRADINKETNLSGTFITKAIAAGIGFIYKW